MEVPGISYNDWAAAFGEIAWNYKMMVTNIPWHVWLFIVLAVGVKLLERRCLKIVNPTVESSPTAEKNEN